MRFSNYPNNFRVYSDVAGPCPVTMPCYGGTRFSLENYLEKLSPENYLEKLSRKIIPRSATIMGEQRSHLSRRRQDASNYCADRRMVVSKVRLQGRDMLRDTRARAPPAQSVDTWDPE